MYGPKKGAALIYNALLKKDKVLVLFLSSEDYDRVITTTA